MAQRGAGPHRQPRLPARRAVQGHGLGPRGEAARVVLLAAAPRAHVSRGGGRGAGPRGRGRSGAWSPIRAQGAPFCLFGKREQRAAPRRRRCDGAGRAEAGARPSSGPVVASPPPPSPPPQLAPRIDERLKAETTKYFGLQSDHNRKQWTSLYARQASEREHVAKELQRAMEGTCEMLSAPVPAAVSASASARLPPPPQSFMDRVLQVRVVTAATFICTSTLLLLPLLLPLLPPTARPSPSCRTAVGPAHTHTHALSSRRCGATRTRP